MLIKKIIERIKALFPAWREKVKRKLILLLIGILALLVFISALTEIKREKTGLAPTLFPSPTPVEEEITAPSAYATDSAILAVEEELKILENDLFETDLYETGLNPSVFKMGVEFEE